MKQGDGDGGGAEGSIDMDYWRSVHLHITGSYNQAVPITKNLTKCPENPMFRMQKPPQRCLSEGQIAGNNECHAFDRPQHVTGGKGGERWGGYCLLMMSGVFIILQDSHALIQTEDGELQVTWWSLL